MRASGVKILIMVVMLSGWAAALGFGFAAVDNGELVKECWRER